MNGEAPIYHHTGDADASANDGEKESFGRTIYKNLKNGVSHMLPILAGFIAMSIADRPGLAAGYVILLLKKIADKVLPASLEGIKPMLIYPVAGILLIGAIPYAEADPLRVIPSCMICSAVGGALSMIFGCTLMAPHCGLWVVAVIGNPFAYVAALVIGSVVTAVLLGVLKKDIAE